MSLMPPDSVKSYRIDITGVSIVFNHSLPNGINGQRIWMITDKIRDKFKDKTYEEFYKWYQGGCK